MAPRRDSRVLSSSVANQPDSMQNSIAHGRRVALRTVVFQVCVAGLVGLVFCFGGMRSALSAWYGGAAIVLGNALFAWRLFADGVAPARRVAFAMFVAEVLKWVVIVSALYLALAILKLPAWPLLSGVVLAHIAFWLATGYVR